MVTKAELLTALEPDEIDYDAMVRFLGRDALPHLPELIDSTRPDIAAKATSLAGRMSVDERISLLERAAQSPHAVVRIAAAAATERVSAPEAERLVPLLLTDAEPAVRKLAIRAAAPVSGLPLVSEMLADVAASDPIDGIRDLAGEVPGHPPDTDPSSDPPPDNSTRKVPAMATDDEILERAIAKYGPVLDLRSNPQALIDLLRVGRIRGQDDGGPLPGGVPEPPPGPTSMQESEATLDDVMAEVLNLSRRLTDATKEITQLRKRLG